MHQEAPSGRADWQEAQLTFAEKVTAAQSTTVLLLEDVAPGSVVIAFGKPSRPTLPGVPDLASEGKLLRGVSEPYRPEEVQKRIQ